MTQNNYLCVILHVTCKKLLILTVFIWFLILDKIQDGDHVWWRQKPPALLSPTKCTLSCREDQGLSTEGKIASKYCNISKNKGGSLTPPPSCTTVGVWLCVYVWGLMNQTAQLRILKNYSLKSRWIVAKYLPSRESGEVNIPKATIHRDLKE